jgi:hypothetical protein
LAFDLPTQTFRPVNSFQLFPRDLMRRIVKPFAVETRRSGRKANAAPPAPEKLQIEPPPPPIQTKAPPSEALRAAQALFGKPETMAAKARQADAPGTSEPARRILQSLTEEDPIALLLAAEASEKKKRRKLRLLKARPEKAQAKPRVPASAPVLPAQAAASLPGYVRGLIYARYARHDAARPGEQWRKRSVKPLW